MCGGVSAAEANVDSQAKAAAKAKTQYVNTAVDHTTYGWLLQDATIPDGVTYNGASWYPYAPMTEERVAVGFNGATVPTEYMAGRLYDVGDNNTDIMMFAGDGGELTLLDMGNRLATYQYYLKIEQCGYDPRNVNTIFLTHGHFDHFEGLYEFSGMVRRAGKNLTTMANGYIEGAVVSNDEISVELTPMVTEQSVLYSVNTILKWDEWQYFMVEGAALYPYRAIGHSKDTTNFCFKLVAKKEDKFFDEGTVVGWFYQGGLGMINSVSRGAERLQFMNSLMYAQSKAAPWLAAQCDVTYFMNQHTLVYPYLELDKGARLANIPLMSIVTPGLENIANVQENRVSMMMYRRLEDAYLAGESLYNELLAPYGVYDKAFKERGTYSIDTIEEHGPWKRAAGEYDITIESVTVLHGFDGVFKSGEALRGQKNVYGWDMADGVLVPWVSYSHDPDSWYVQVICSVNDDYNGCFYVDTNWFQGDYITHNKTAEGTVVDKSTITEGLVEMGNDPYNWREVLRTEKFNSKEEAEEFARQLTGGKYTTPYEAYTVNGDLLYTYDDVEDHDMSDYGNTKLDTRTYAVTLDKASNILLGDSFEDTFKPTATGNESNDSGSSRSSEATTPAQPERPTTPTTPGSYTVQEGDTWHSICVNFYGTNTQRYELMKANKDIKLKAGAVITLPEKLGKDTQIPAPAAAAGEKLYTVKAGDTLGKIAAAEYGKAGEYKAIFERNADRLKDANTIYEGQVIVLPTRK